jgi:hypothetical protein
MDEDTTIAGDYTYLQSSIPTTKKVATPNTAPKPTPATQPS